MKKLTIFTLYGSKGPSAKYRIIQFINDLSEEYEVKLFPFWNETYSVKYMRDKRKYAVLIVVLYVVSFIKRIFQILTVGKNSDVILFQKSCIPKCKLNLIRYLKKNRVRVVFDVDDAVYLLKRDNSKIIASQVDTVLCGNKTLYEVYSKYNNDCRIVPTVEYTPAYEIYRSDTFKSKIIGWIGSKTTLYNLEVIVEPLNRLMEMHPEVRFVIISDSAKDLTERIQNAQLVVWDEKTYLEQLSKITVGIMPLKNTNMNRGKCGFKLIQYLSMGKPVIASGIGVNREIVGDFGFIAENSEQWISYMEQLLYEEVTYRVCEKNISEKFLGRYSYYNVLNQIRDALKGE